MTGLLHIIEKDMKTKILIGIASALILAGCARDDFGGGLRDRRIMKFVPAEEANAWQEGTKSDIKDAAAKPSREKVVGDVIDLTSEDGSMTIKMVCIESENELQNSVACDTKGQLINTGTSDANISNFVEATDKKLYVYPFDASGAPAFGGEIISTWKGDAWMPDDVIYWPQSTKYSFYGYCNLPASGTEILVDHSNKKYSISHTVPENIEEQRDILVSDLASETDGNGTGTVSLKLNHILTAVRFKRDSSVDPTVVTGVGRIIIENVYKSGTAEFKASKEEAEPRLVWTPDEDSRTVIQGDESSTLEVSEDEIDGDPFLVIPTTATAPDVSLTVYLVVNGHQTAFNAIISMSSGGWEAGHVYTYVIGYNELLKGEIEEEEIQDKPDDDSKKGSCVFYNEGNVPMYVRVLIGGNVMDKDGFIKVNWNPRLGILAYDSNHQETSRRDSGNNPATAVFAVEEGTFGDNTSAWCITDKWKLGDDGFYYYLDPLKAETITSGTDEPVYDGTSALFKSFTQNGLMDDESLEMIISAQYVEADEDKSKVRSAWGSAAADMLNALQ